MVTICNGLWDGLFIMKITKEDIDALNSVVKIDISANDYQEKVDKAIKDQAK